MTLNSSGNLSVGDGTASLPSYANVGDLNTGIYFPAADTVGVVAGGTEQFRFGSNPIPGGSKNLVINGAMNVSQRGSNAVILAGFDSSTNTYGPDRFLMSGNGSPQNRGEVEHVLAGGPTGFPSFFRYDVTTAESAVAAGEGTLIQHRIEGYITNRLSWGNAAAKPVTLSFYMRSPKTGTHCVALYQSGNRSHVKEFTVASADTWEKHSVTFAADTSGSLSVVNAEGLRIQWPIIAGSTYQVAADTWASGLDFATSNQQNLADNTANNIDLTGVQLEVGSVATDFAHEDIGTTLQKCKRYFERITPAGNGQPLGSGFAQSTVAAQITLLYEEKRAVPTIDSTGSATFAVVHTGAVSSGTTGLSFDQTGTTSCRMNLTHGSSMTDGQGIQISRDALDTTYIQMSAEL